MRWRNSDFSTFFVFEEPPWKISWSKQVCGFSRKWAESRAKSGVRKRSFRLQNVISVNSCQHKSCSSRRDEAFGLLNVQIFHLLYCTGRIPIDFSTIWRHFNFDFFHFSYVKRLGASFEIVYFLYSMENFSRWLFKVEKKSKNQNFVIKISEIANELNWKVVQLDETNILIYTLPEKYWIGESRKLHLENGPERISQVFRNFVKRK